MKRASLSTLCLPTLAAALVLAAAGCVKKSTYEALQASSASTEAKLSGELAAERKTSASLDDALKAEQARAADLEKQIAGLNDNLEATRIEMNSVLKDRSKMAASIEEMTVALKALEAQRKRTDARVAEYRKLLDAFKKLIDAGKLRVKIVNGRMVVVLPSDILFASGSAGLSKEGKEAITEIAGILSQMGKRTFQIEGHTDDQPIKTARFPNNWALAAGRATAVLEVMAEAGMDAHDLSAASYGAMQPAVSNETREGRSQNRRIEIALVPDFSVLPGFDELKKMSK